MNETILTFIITALIWGLIVGYIFRKKKKKQPKPTEAEERLDITYKKPENTTP